MLLPPRYLLGKGEYVCVCAKVALKAFLCRQPSLRSAEPTYTTLSACRYPPHVFAQKSAISFFPRMQFLDQHKRYSSGVGEFIPLDFCFFFCEPREKVSNKIPPFLRFSVRTSIFHPEANECNERSAAGHSQKKKNRGRDRVSRNEKNPTVYTEKNK